MMGGFQGENEAHKIKLGMVGLKRGGRSTVVFGDKTTD